MSRRRAVARPSAPAAPTRWLGDIEASAPGPEVGAFFDFDGTLLAGYSIAAFIAERWRRRELGPAELARSAADGYSDLRCSGRFELGVDRQLGERVGPARRHLPVEPPFRRRERNSHRGQ